ncbi:MAG: phosphatase PAP2 family protein [Phycisphaerales bacterium]|nr:phosphatase PAP2 family protein [Phycisphaerales bacterium]
MTTLQPPYPDHLTRRSRERTIRIVLWWLIGFVVALAWDKAAYNALAVTAVGGEAAHHAKASLEARDWYRLLRITGYLPTWFCVATIFFLTDRARASRGLPPPLLPHADTWPNRAGLRRAALLLLCTIGSGAAAELIKLIIGRVRPGASIGSGLWYDFRLPLSGLLTGADLGFPSSHAAVAFAAAFAMTTLLRPARPVVLALAIGCAYTRLAAGAHFLSDVYAAAGLSYAVCAWFRRLDARNNAGTHPLLTSHADARPANQSFTAHHHQ